MLLILTRHRACLNDNNTPLLPNNINIANNTVTSSSYTTKKYCSKNTGEMNVFLFFCLYAFTKEGNMFSICSFYFLLLLHSLKCSPTVQFRSQSVPTSSIMKTIEVSSITQCLFQCWKKNFDCKYIGFLSSHLNNKNNIEKATCYMITTDNGDGLRHNATSQPTIFMTVLVRVIGEGGFYIDFLYSML